MRFHTLATDNNGALSGVATNDRCDPARAFCDAYRRASLDMLTADSLRLEPVFGSLNEEPASDNEALRFHFSAEEEPGLFSAVFDCLGHEPSEFDIAVLMREEMLAQPITPEGVMAIVVQDAASVLTDDGGEVEGLGWASPDITRAAIAAVLVRGIEPLLPNAAAIDAAYREVCACALEGLMRAREGRRHPEAIFVRENPGLITLIDRAVARARMAAAPSLPMNAGDVLRDAMKNLNAALYSTGPLQLAAA